MTEVETLKHQNQLMADALAEIIMASGIVREDVGGFTVPQLLFFAKDVVSMLKLHETFRAISDPENAHIFSAEAAQKAFKDVDVGLTCRN